MYTATILWKNVNTVCDRKKIIAKILKQVLPTGKIIIFLFPSFWGALYFYNSFKKRNKNIIRFRPLCVASLKTINFSDYYTFLKLVASSKKLPENIFLFIFDLNLLIQSKYFSMFKILYDSGLKFSSSVTTLSSTLDYEKYIKFDRVCKLKSNFRLTISFKHANNFTLPSGSIFFCLDRKLLHSIAEKEGSDPKIPHSSSYKTDNLLQRSKFVTLFQNLLTKNIFYFSYDLPYYLYSRLYKIYSSHKIKRIFLDNFYFLPVCKRYKIFIYPYKNGYTLVPPGLQVFHSTFFTTRKATIFLLSDYHKNFFNTLQPPSPLYLYRDELLEMLFKIKVKKLFPHAVISECVDTSNSSVKVLLDNGLIKISTKSNKIYLTYIGKLLLKNLVSPVIYIKVKKFLTDSKSSETETQKVNNYTKFDALCIYLLYLLNYSNSCVVWWKIKKILEGEIEFVEGSYRVSAGLLFNIFKKVFNVLVVLDETGLLPSHIKVELLHLKNKFKSFYIEINHTDTAQKGIETTREIIINKNKYTVSLAGKEISLPIGAFKLLLILVQNPYKLMPYPQLYFQIYGKEDPLFKYTLQNEKTYLCKKLQKIGVDTTIIESIAYQGYRLNPKDYVFRIE